MSKDLLKKTNNASSAEILNEKEKSFVFYNASLGRRILSYLADIFISFIACVFILEIICFPIAKHVTNYEDSVAEILNFSQSRYSLFYDNDILYCENSDEEKYNFDKDFEYTGDQFVKFYVLKDSVGIDNLLPDPIINYYVNVAKPESRKTIAQVSRLYYGDEQVHEYFEPLNAEVSPYLSLKESWIERWKPYFDANDEVSDEIKTEIKGFKLSCFRSYELSVITDFSKTNDVYEIYTNNINSIQNSFDNMYQITTICAFLFVFICFFVVTPLVEKHGRTLGKIFLKLEVVNNKNFQYVEKKWRIAAILLTLLEQLPIILFVPFITVGITEIFTLPILLILTIISAFYVLISLIIAFANKLNYSIKELLTRTVVVDRALMDQYYREVVYAEERTTIE